MEQWGYLTERQLQKNIPYIFLCEKRGCKSSRPETLVDENLYNVTRINGGQLLEKIRD